MNDAQSTPCGAARWRWMRSILLAGGIGLMLVTLALLYWLRGALYNHWIRYPREEAAWRALRAERQEVAEPVSWKEYRGILHSHSHLSHDCEVPFEDIARAMEGARLDFIGLSDHPIAVLANFGKQWRGLHGGRLFIPGYEMRDGIMPFGVASSITLSNHTPTAALARQIVDHGGVLFFAHPENPRAWEVPQLTGMEIYNLHTDFKQLPGGLAGMWPEILLNLRRYPDQLHRRVFRRPVAFLRRWDELNRTRHITGIAGNDCHQNVGVRGMVTADGAIRVEDTSPRLLKEYKLNWFTRLLARLAFGPLEPGRRVFHLQLDPYERSARYVNTHVLARELTETAVLDALRAGRVFVGFDMIADSAGFRWFVRSAEGVAVMGESSKYAPEIRLGARSPLPCRFTIVKDGENVHRAEGRTLDWSPVGPGKYRVEAEVNILGEWIPWVYANPIELR